VSTNLASELSKLVLEYKFAKHSKINFYFIIFTFFALLPIFSKADYLLCDALADSARNFALRRDSGEKMREMVKEVMESAAKKKDSTKTSKKDLDIIASVHLLTIESIFGPSQINSTPEIIYNENFIECMKISRKNK
jgi:hypothetical protein